jgi:hypothetical protein
VCSPRRVEAGHRLHELRLPVADSGIVDDCIEIAEPVGLVGDGFCLRDTRKITDHDVLGAGDRLPDLVRTRGAAVVQDDRVSLFD